MGPKMFAGLIHRNRMSPHLPQLMQEPQVIEIIRLRVMEERERRAGQRVARD